MTSERMEYVNLFEYVQRSQTFLIFQSQVFLVRTAGTATSESQCRGTTAKITNFLLLTCCAGAIFRNRTLLIKLANVNLTEITLVSKKL